MRRVQPGRDGSTTALLEKAGLTVCPCEGLESMAGARCCPVPVLGRGIWAEEREPQSGTPHRPNEELQGPWSLRCRLFPLPSTARPHRDVELRLQ